MDFKEQISDLKLTIQIKPRFYLQWTNNEIGRDKRDCYERIEDNNYVRYINTNNKSLVTIKGDKFFDVLEEMYHTELIKIK